MTHKDFVLIAGALASARNLTDETSSRYATMYAVITSLIDVLATTNPRFDRERFIAAANGTPITGRDKVKS